MATIEVSFDVFKELTNLRESEEVTYSDVIEKLLRTNGQQEKPGATEGVDGWQVKGVLFPEGTEFRACYKGKVFTGIVHGNGVIVNGQSYHTPSGAANAITHTNLNGWGFWQCRLPGKSEWKPIYTLRQE